MTEQELKMFLAKAAIIDKRSIDQATLLHWGEILGDISYLEASAALIQARRTMKPGEYLVPSHITLPVYKWRDQHAMGHPQNPGTRGLVYVADLGQYLPPSEVPEALNRHHQTPRELGTNGDSS